MRTQLEHRLGQLRAEYETGEKVLAELEAKQARLRETLLRISGAIQVLEEALAEENGAEESGASDEPLLHDAESAGNPRFAA
ncbi:hypothetical protein [Methyloterricola oryzae]|uniref:hypothetical protein n=1 Tax=Methyloterricola oryzae TaxID=1495050 RepID=UPI0005EB09CC|nr:hypothetical protein [Methyloterricola oryzae]